MTTADLARAEAMKPQSMGTILAGLKKTAWSSANHISQMDDKFYFH